MRTCVLLLVVASLVGSVIACGRVSGQARNRLVESYRTPFKLVSSTPQQPGDYGRKLQHEFNKCHPQPEVKRIGKAVMERYPPTEGGAEVILWTLEDGGHTWPGGRVNPNVEALGMGKMGKVNQDINASDLMWEFFRKHSLP